MKQGAHISVPDMPANVVHVVLAPGLLRLFPEAPARVDVAAATVAELIAALDVRWPGMGRMLADERPAVRQHISIFAGSARATLATPLSSGATVHVLTAVSGG